MTPAATPDVRPIVPQSAHREEPALFVRWALAQLSLPVEQGERDAVLLLPEADRPAFAGQQRLRLPLTGQSAAGQESLDWDGRFGRWLVDRLHQRGPAVHARPLYQPMTVADVTGSLFSAYQVDGGQVHLAGCQLTDHPFLRLSFAGEEPEGAIHHIYVAPDGSSVSDELVPRLGLDVLEPITKLPPRIDENALRLLVAAGHRIAAKLSTVRDPSAVVVEPIATAIVWVRHAEGRLQFTIGKSAASHPFSSWAKLLTPKPFFAKYSGANTFHVAATDDGRIDAADQIATCQQSGRRVLRQELVECSVTGKHVLPDFTETCPVSGRPVLRHEFVSCTICKQHVSKAVMNEGACEACRSMTSVSKDDPRLVWIFGEHPGLDNWKGWQLAETQSVYIAQAASLLKKLLVVVEKESLIVRRLAVATRLSATWIDASDAERADLLN
jgi:hypothetical protein